MKTWYKVKNKRIFEIEKPNKKEIETLLNSGYVVSSVNIVGNKTKIKIFSPLTYREYRYKGKMFN